MVSRRRSSTLLELVALERSGRAMPPRSRNWLSRFWADWQEQDGEVLKWSRDVNCIMLSGCEAGYGWAYF